MAGAPTDRQRRVGDLLRAEISEILRMKMRDPRLGFLTVTDVSVTRDLRHALVFVSVLEMEGGGPADSDLERDSAVIEVLSGAAGFVRGELSNRVELKHIPELRFKIDKSAERGVRISAMLKDILDHPKRDGR
jgi:ribosome-binding factor A